MLQFKEFVEEVCPECGKDHEGECATEAISHAKKLARRKANLLKTMKKYGDATKMGIPADQVNQRRNAPTRKK